MRQHQGRVRRMRQLGQHPGSGRSTDGIRQTYHDPAIRAARATANAANAARPGNQTEEQAIPA